MNNSDTQFVEGKTLTTIRLNTDFSDTGVKNPLTPIQRDLFWLQDYIRDFIYILFHHKIEDKNIEETVRSKRKLLRKSVFPPLDTDFPYDAFIKDNCTTPEERFVILTALAPYFSAGLLKELNYDNPATNKPFPELGGLRLSNGEFLPTIDTLRFLVANERIVETSRVDSALKENGNLIKNNIIRLSNQTDNTYWNKQVVQPTEEFLALIKGEEYEPSFNSNFPASKITTPLNWNDLILSYDTKQELKEVNIWLKHKDSVMQHQHLSRIIKPGFRCLFYARPVQVKR